MIYCGCHNTHCNIEVNIVSNNSSGQQAICALSSRVSTVNSTAFLHSATMSHSSIPSGNINYHPIRHRGKCLCATNCYLPRLFRQMQAGRTIVSGKIQYFDILLYFQSKSCNCLFSPPQSRHSTLTWMPCTSLA